MTHADLVQRASGRPDCVLLLANYYDAWQLSLDGNLLAIERAARREEADKWAACILDRVAPPVNFYTGAVSVIAVMLRGDAPFPSGMGETMKRKTE